MLLMKLGFSDMTKLLCTGFERDASAALTAQVDDVAVLLAIDGVLPICIPSTLFVYPQREKGRKQSTNTDASLRSGEGQGVLEAGKRWDTHVALVCRQLNTNIPLYLCLEQDVCSASIQKRPYSYVQ